MHTYSKRFCPISPNPDPNLIPNPIPNPIPKPKHMVKSGQVAFNKIQ